MPYVKRIFNDIIYFSLVALVILWLVGSSDFIAEHYFIVIIGLFLFNVVFDTLSFFVKWGRKAKEVAHIGIYSFIGLIYLLPLLKGSTSFVSLIILLLAVLATWNSVYNLRQTTIPSKEYKQLH